MLRFLLLVSRIGVLTHQRAWKINRLPLLQPPSIKCCALDDSPLFHWIKGAKARMVPDQLLVCRSSITYQSGVTTITSKPPGLPGVKQQIKALQNQPANFSSHFSILEGRDRENHVSFSSRMHFDRASPLLLTGQKCRPKFARPQLCSAWTFPDLPALSLTCFSCNSAFSSWPAVRG